MQSRFLFAAPCTPRKQIQNFRCGAHAKKSKFNFFVALRVPRKANSKFSLRLARQIGLLQIFLCAARAKKG
jgi:hypothetical protein